MPQVDINRETKHLNNPIVIEAPSLSASYEYNSDDNDNIELLLLKANAGSKYSVTCMYKTNPSFDFVYENSNDTFIEYGDFDTELPPEYYENNLKKLNISFNKELSAYSHYLTTNTKNAKDIFNQIASLISYFQFKNATVELTKTNSIKFTLIFPGNKLLMISKPLSSIDNLKEEEVIFSLFINRELIASNAVPGTD